MNYSTDIQRSLEYIEANIKGKLTPEIIAKYIGYSIFHFCRVFHTCMNTSVMEYVRKRRLALAAVELFEGKKIIDIALEYGFETHSGFAKAFRKEYGYSPTQYAIRMAGFRGIVSEGKTTLEFGGYIMNPIILHKPSFKVAGYGIKTNIEDGNYTKDIAAFWNNYDTKGWESKLYKQLNPLKHGEVGICMPEDKESGKLIYLLGVIVENFDNVTDEMITLEVPEATYAVFTTPPVDTSEGSNNNQSNVNDFPIAIKQTWKYIFEVWFGESEYTYDESKLDFEFYDERCHFRPDTVMDIYIPILKK